MTRQPGIYADFPGECAKCGHGYGRGDRIVQVSAGWVHVGCAAGSGDE